MYATQKNQLRRLSQQEFNALTVLCRLSKNSPVHLNSIQVLAGERIPRLFNVALYEARQYFFQERKRLTYESNYHICKSNENYQALNTDIAQQTMKVVDRSMKSFLGLLKAIGIGRCSAARSADRTAPSGQARFALGAIAPSSARLGRFASAPKMPRYLNKEGYFPLIIPRIKLKDGCFAVPMSREFKKEYGEVKIQLPERLKDKQIKEVRIHPKYSARWFEIEYIYFVQFFW